MRRSKRSFILGALSLVSTKIFAQTMPPQMSYAPGIKPPEPFRTLDKPIAQDSKKVVEFFAYTCHVCQRFHGPIVAWARTLPKAVRFETVPLPLSRSDEEIQFVMFRAAVTLTQPDREEVFDASVLSQLQANNNQLSEDVIVNAFKDALIDVNKIMKVDQELLTKQMMTWYQRVADYQIKVTPSVGVGGRYVATMDAVPGREDLFPTLLNGLVSKIL